MIYTSCSAALRGSALLTTGRSIRPFASQSVGLSKSLSVGLLVWQSSLAVGQPVGQSVGQSVGQPVGQLVGQPAGQPVCQTVGQSVGQTVGQSVGQ